MQEVTTGMRERGIGDLEWVDREGLVGMLLVSKSGLVEEDAVEVFH